MSSSVFDVGSPAAVFAAVAASAAMKYMAGVLLIKPNQFRYVGKVGEIWLFPVKSMKGTLVQEANAELLGLDHYGIRDRHWVMVKPDGKYLSQRDYPKMILIQLSVQGDAVEMKAPGMEAIRFPVQPTLDPARIRKVTVFCDTVDALDMGDEVSDWLSRFLEADGLRLCFSESSLEKRDTFDRTKKWNTLAQKGDMCAFPNFSSYMVLSQPSVDFINTKLANPVPLTNFRPNIVVHDCQPFDEDTWSSIRIGRACQLRGLDPTTRCALTTVDQKTGTKDQHREPLNTLMKFRLFKPYHSAIVGCNYALDAPGTIRVGDPIYATFRKTPLYTLP